MRTEAISGAGRPTVGGNWLVSGPPGHLANDRKRPQTSVVLKNLTHKVAQFSATRVSHLNTAKCRPWDARLSVYVLFMKAHYSSGWQIKS